MLGICIAALSLVQFLVAFLFPLVFLQFKEEEEDPNSGSANFVRLNFGLSKDPLVREVVGEFRRCAT